ncbi:heme A synthase [Vibrio gallaecicus]|uniref:COX15/CtaA family protein n=1 Tax=Vibrio gallaecicus TaxID=552386 RepID=UPI0010C97226|nr:COX15/CtaA family protein [Vibrio gallaecicus]MDN3616535.1 COX15/CtaA family protein [Vibrio gallaecicus]
MVNETPKNLTLLVKVSLLLTLTVIVLGAYTRLSDAGLGCPDWPGCYGSMVVPSDSSSLSKAAQLYPGNTIESDKAWLEMIHRYFAGTLGIVIFCIVAWCLKIKNISPKLPLTILFVVVFQAALGMWTVTLKLMPLVVMAHLLGGFTLFSLLAILYCKLNRLQQHIDPLYVDPSVRFWALASLGIVILQIFLGGWTSSNYAALMCTSLPICEGNWIAYLDFSKAFDLLQSGHENYEFGVLEYPARMTIHVTHRIGAIVTSCVVLVLVWKLAQQPCNIQNSLAKRVGTLLLLQITLGIGNVVLQLPISVAVLHNLVAALLLVSIVTTNFLLWHRQDYKTLIASNVVPIGNAVHHKSRHADYAEGVEYDK